MSIKRVLYWYSVSFYFKVVWKTVSGRWNVIVTGFFYDATRQVAKLPFSRKPVLRGAKSIFLLKGPSKNKSLFLIFRGLIQAKKINLIIKITNFVTIANDWPQ